ncbi:MAG: M23 family metallopeptidase [Pyrinomonadaceae bacterium]
MSGRAKKSIVTGYLVVIHALLGYLIWERIGSWSEDRGPVEVAAVPVASLSPADFPILDPESSDVPEAEPPSTTPTVLSTPNLAAGLRPEGLIIPVANYRREQLTDSFTQARSNGRLHDAIDIMAPAGTPVVATADGEILKFFDSKAGGITIYQASVDHRFIYYYAHLQSRAPDLKEGEVVKQGRTIGLVGDTGNAGAGNYHLHFSVASTDNPKRYWEGVYLNPYPLLRN